MDLNSWKKLKSLKDEGLIDNEEYFSFLEDYEAYIKEELIMKEKNLNESLSSAVTTIIDKLYPNGYNYRMA